jgi:hypothetical protein
MAGANLTVDVNSLRKLAEHLRDAVNSLPQAPEPTAAQFGQNSAAGFAPAQQLAESYGRHTATWSAGLNDFDRGIRALAEALDIMAKRYSDNENASALDADAVRQALAAGWTASPPATPATAG